MLIPVNNFGFNDEGIREFNNIYKYCLQQEANGIFQRRFVITKSQGISIAHGNIRGPMWSIKAAGNKTFAEILIRNPDGRYYRFIIGHHKDKEQNMYGRKAFQIYKQKLLEFNVNIEDFALESDEGFEVKQTIPSPKIGFKENRTTAERTYYNCHHIDLHSAYNAGMMKAFPAFEPAIREMYNMRKVMPEYKDVLNMTQGMLQSEILQYRFSHISKAGYVFVNEQLDIMAEKLRTSGRRILAYNTDGIWYQGDLYEDSTFGPDIGQWDTDYKNCKVRFAGDGGSYEVFGEIKEKGLWSEPKYVVHARGKLAIEKTFPREEWTWENSGLFKSPIINYYFVEGIGFIEQCY